MSKLVDLSGTTVDDIYIESITNKRTNNGKIIWKCRCLLCNNECYLSGDKIKYYKTRLNCGCQKDTGFGRGKKSKLNKYIEYSDFVVGFATNTNKEFYVDKEDYQIISKYSWYESDTGYIMSRIEGKLVRLHRFIMNAPNDMCVDHINHKRTDCRKSNMRLCTRKENCHNYGMSSLNKSGVTGVCWDSGKNKWLVTIQKKFIGYYDDFQEAVKIRQKEEQIRYGEFAPLDTRSI